MRHVDTLAAALALGCLLEAAPSEAKVLDLYASLKGGWVTGGGSNSLAANAADYFELERGPALGFEVGAEILFLDLMINGTRMFDPRSTDEAGVQEGSGGTFFQFLLGIDGDFALDGGAVPSTFLRVGGNAGVGLGLHREVRAPLDDSQVSDKGFVFNGVLALDQHLSRFFVVGLEVQPGYHIFFPGGAKQEQGVSGDDHSRGFHFMTLAFVQFHLDPVSWFAARPAEPKPSKPRHEFLPLQPHQPDPANLETDEEDPEDEDADDQEAASSSP